jgi:hypothetical protein
MKIKLANQDLTTEYEKEINKILKVLGFPEALVTDESWLSDFALDDKKMAKVEKLANAHLRTNSTLIEIAQKMRKISEKKGLK